MEGLSLHRYYGYNVLLGAPHQHVIRWYPSLGVSLVYSLSLGGGFLNVSIIERDGKTHKGGQINTSFIASMLAVESTNSADLRLSISNDLLLVAFQQTIVVLFLPDPEEYIDNEACVLLEHWIEIRFPGQRIERLLCNCDMSTIMITEGDSSYWLLLDLLGIHRAMKQRVFGEDNSEQIQSKASTRPFTLLICTNKTGSTTLTRVNHDLSSIAKIISPCDWVDCGTNNWVLTAPHKSRHPTIVTVSKGIVCCCEIGDYYVNLLRRIELPNIDDQCTALNIVFSPSGTHMIILAFGSRVLVVDFETLILLRDFRDVGAYVIDYCLNAFSVKLVLQPVRLCSLSAADTIISPAVGGFCYVANRKIEFREEIVPQLSPVNWIVFDLSESRERPSSLGLVGVSDASVDDSELLEITDVSSRVIDLTNLILESESHKQSVVSSKKRDLADSEATDGEKRVTTVNSKPKAAVPREGNKLSAKSLVSVDPATQRAVLHALRNRARVSARAVERVQDYLVEKLMLAAATRQLVAEAIDRCTEKKSSLQLLQDKYLRSIEKVDRRSFNVCEDERKGRSCAHHIIASLVDSNRVEHSHKDEGTTVNATFPEITVVEILMSPLSPSEHAVIVFVLLKNSHDSMPICDVSLRACDGSPTQISALCAATVPPSITTTSAQAAVVLPGESVWLSAKIICCGYSETFDRVLPVSLHASWRSLAPRGSPATAQDFAFSTMLLSEPERLCNDILDEELLPSRQSDNHFGWLCLVPYEGVQQTMLDSIEQFAVSIFPMPAVRSSTAESIKEKMKSKASRGYSFVSQVQVKLTKRVLNELTVRHSAITETTIFAYELAAIAAWSKQVRAESIIVSPLIQPESCPTIYPVQSDSAADQSWNRCSIYADASDGTSSLCKVIRALQAAKERCNKSEIFAVSKASSELVAVMNHEVEDILTIQKSAVSRLVDEIKLIAVSMREFNKKAPMMRQDELSPADVELRRSLWKTQLLTDQAMLAAMELCIFNGLRL